MEQTFGQKVREERKRRGISQQALAELAHTSQGAIDRIERDVVKDSRAGPRVAAALGIEFPLGEVAKADAASQAQAPRPSKAELVGVADLPIYAAVRGGSYQDSVLVSSDAIDYVKRPEPLANAKNGYGLYVIGDSMFPAFRNGDLALIHPNLPYNAGDEVIVSGVDENGEHYAVLKQLTKVTADKWHLRQYNPPHGEPAEFTLDRQRWPVCHLVVGSYRRR